jgi:outer membrane lipoprotein-sorting protein
VTIRTKALTAAAAVLMLGAAACTQAEQDKAEVHAETAADKTASAASQAGEVIEGGAMKAAQAVESGAGKVADKLETEQAQAAAEGKPGAIDPATDTRVPAKH